MNFAAHFLKVWHKGIGLGKVIQSMWKTQSLIGFLKKRDSAGNQTQFSPTEIECMGNHILADDSLTFKKAVKCSVCEHDLNFSVHVLDVWHKGIGPGQASQSLWNIPSLISFLKN